MDTAAAMAKTRSRIEMINDLLYIRHECCPPLGLRVHWEEVLFIVVERATMSNNLFFRVSLLSYPFKILDIPSFMVGGVEVQK